MQAASEAANRVTHSYRVIGELSNLLSNIKDAETGERGFIITGDRMYLAPYRDAQGTLRGVLANLPGLKPSPATAAGKHRVIDQGKAGTIG